ncbi:MAG: hypothetical protein CMM47_06815 [Rhodospirillaceae bacterium]|nr:hypothetical protein [Rhodospirillaceae bacterium]
MNAQQQKFAAQGLQTTVLIVGFLILVQGTGALAGFWLPAIAPAVAAGVSLDPSLIAYAVLIQYVVAMLSSLIAGGMVNRFGAWRTSQLALFGLAIAHLLFMTGTIWGIVLGSAALGGAYGMITPPASHLLSKIVTPANRNLVFSIRFTGVPIGGMAAGLTAPATALVFGWQESMTVTVVIALALALAMQPFRGSWDADRNTTSPILRNPLGDLALVWRIASLRWVALSGLCMGAVQTTLTTYTVTMLVEDLGYNLVAAGIGFSAVQVSSIVGRVGWGWLADRVGSGLTISSVITIIAAGCAILTISLTPDWPRLLVYMLCFIFGSVGMGWNGVYASEIARLAPTNKVGAATGASMFITFSGVFLGPMIFVAMFELTGVYTTTFAVSAVVALMALFCLIQASRCDHGV